MLPLLKRLSAMVGKRTDAFNKLILEILAESWPLSMPVIVDLLDKRLTDKIHADVIALLGTQAKANDKRAIKALIQLLPPHSTNIKYNQHAHTALRVATGLRYGPSAKEWEIHFDDSIRYTLSGKKFKGYAADGFAIEFPDDWLGDRGSFRAPAGEAGLTCGADGRTLAGVTMAMQTKKQEGEPRTTKFAYKTPDEYWLKTFEAACLAVAGENKGKYRAGLEPITKPALLATLPGKSGGARLYSVVYRDKASDLTRTLIGGMMIAQRREASGSRTARPKLIQTQVTIYLTINCSSKFYDYYEPLLKRIIESIHLTR